MVDAFHPSTLTRRPYLRCHSDRMGTAIIRGLVAASSTLYSSPIVSFPNSMTPPSKSETDGANDARSRGSVKDAPTTNDDMQVRTIGE